MRLSRFSVRAIVFAAVAVGLLAPSSALAADGFGPLSGSEGCLVAVGSGASEGVRGCAPGKGLYGARAVAVSPDGANVYVAGGVAGDDVAKSYGAVAILKRNPATGGLVELGCLSSDGTDREEGASGSCTPEPSLLGADGVAVSPDGKTVYVTSSSSASVVAFARDAATGALTRLGCFQGTPRPGAPCGAANLLSSASSPVVSADGSSLYVAAPLSGAVSALDSSDRLRTPAGIVPALPASSTSGSGATAPGATDATSTGSATSAPQASPSLSSIFTTSLIGDELLNPCIAVNGLDGTCSVGVASQGLRDLVLSPDGKQLYGAAPGGSAIDVFAPATGGGLSETGCVMLGAPRGLCSSDSALRGPSQLAISPDGKSLYAADAPGLAFEGGQLDVLSRDPATGALAGMGCIGFEPKPEPEEEGEEESGEDEEEEGSHKGKRASAAGAADCSGKAPGLDTLSVLAVSGDGSAVYAIGSGNAAIFDRNQATGALSEASCAANEDPRCTSLPPLKEVTDAAVSPDGHQVYVVAQGSNAVMVFGIGAAVATGHASASRAGLARVSVACPAGLRRACSGRLQLTRAVPRAARRGRHRHARHVRRMTAGRSATFSIAPGRHASVEVRLTPRIRRLLARRHRLRLMAVVRANPAAGGSGYGRHVTLALARR